MGLYFLQLLKTDVGGRTMVSELNQFRAEFASNIGADYVLDPREKDLVQRIRALTDLGVDLCIDAVGSLLNVALNTVKRDGTVLLIGLEYGARPCIQQSTIVEHDIRIVGSFIAGYSFPETIQILRSERLPLQKMITHKFTLAEIADGIAAMKSGHGLEVLIYPHQ
jgi:threonine dehydrogenase-like Zn-dependent dehydrogenase